MKTIKPILLIIGILIICVLVFKGLISALSWLDNLPWYAYFPIVGILGYTVYKLGEEFNLWN